MIGVTFRLNDKLVKAEIEHEMEAIPVKTFNKIQDQWRELLEQRLREAASTGPLHKDTGELADSITVVAERVGPTKLRVKVDTGDVPYGNVHEKGGIIKPKTKKWLAIPLPQVKIPGANAMWLKEFRNQFAHGQGFKVFIKPSKSDPGNKLIAWAGQVSGRERGKKQPPVPVYVLVKSVKLKATRWASAAIQASMAELETIVSNADK